MAAKASGKLSIKDLGESDQEGDRRPHDDPQGLQEGRPLQGLLVDLRGVGAVHAERRGRDRVDVVAGRDTAAGSAVPGPLRGAQGGLPRLGRRQRHPQARHGRQARRGLRLPELVEHSGARRHHGHAGLLQRQHLGVARRPHREPGPRRHLRRQLLAQGQGGHEAARRPRRQARHRGRRQARRRLLRARSVRSTPGTRRASTATTCCRSGRSSSTPDRRRRREASEANGTAGGHMAARCTP